MLPEHCVHLVLVVMDYFQSLSLENVTCIPTKGCTVHSSTSEYSATHHRARYSRVRDWEECIILHTYSNMGHVKPTSRKIYSAVKRAKIFDREFQLSRSKKSLFRQTFLLLIVRPSPRLFEKNWFYRLFFVTNKPKLLNQDRSHFLQNGEFQNGKKKGQTNWHPRQGFEPRILEQSLCSILG